MEALVERPTRKRRPPTRDLLPLLVYEEWDGQPVYYRGYRDVLAGKKTPEEIMSCSDLQGVLVALLNGYLYNHLDRKRYLLATNEVGLHLSRGNNLGNDLVILEKATLGPLKGKYFDKPPKVIIEVDIKADTTELPGKDVSYLLKKSQKILDFGTERVIWILTEEKKIFVIDRNDPTWYAVDWSADVTVVDGCVLNLQKLLEDEGILF